MRYLPAIFCMLLQACTTSITRMTERASQAHLNVITVPGEQFNHLIFERTGGAGDDRPVLVFIEGDGRPWRYHGLQPNPDPRPRHALAFELFMATPLPAWYVTRPCYDQHLDAPGCTLNTWTDQRYSRNTVASVAAALHRYATERGIQRLMLIGYSGGGALAVLLANQLHEVVGVISIAANLDVQAWAESQQFSPLLGSLNPATDTGDLALPHIALHGELDRNVRLETLSGFWRTHPSSRLQPIAGYDHVCCWEKNWPMLLSHTLVELSAMSSGSR